MVQFPPWAASWRRRDQALLPGRAQTVGGEPFPALWPHETQTSLPGTLPTRCSPILCPVAPCGKPGRTHAGPLALPKGLAGQLASALGHASLRLQNSRFGRHSTFPASLDLTLRRQCRGGGRQRWCVGVSFCRCGAEQAGVSLGRPHLLQCPRLPLSSCPGTQPPALRSFPSPPPPRPASVALSAHLISTSLGLFLLVYRGLVFALVGEPSNLITAGKTPTPLPVCLALLSPPPPRAPR